MMIQIVLGIVGFPIVLLLIHKLWHEYIVQNGRDPKCNAPMPPGTMGWPVIGETVSLILKGSSFYSDNFKKYNTRLFKTHILGSPTIRIYGSDNLRTILHGENDIVRSKWPKSVRRLIGEQTLTLSSGDHHVLLRKHVSKAFSHSALQGYITLIQPIVREHIRDWCQKGHILAFPTIRAFMFKIAAVALCGFEADDLDLKYLSDVFLDFTKGFFTLPFDLPFSAYRKAIKAKKILQDRLDATLRLKQNIPPEEDTKDAFRILMDDEESYGGASQPHEIICENMIDILNAGFNTISSAATTLLFHTAQNKHVLKKVRLELQDHGILGEDKDLSMETLSDCTYTTNVVKEVLRLSPPVGGGFRKVLKTFELDGYQIPKDWTVIYSIRDTLQLSDGYVNKKEFDPDRFSHNRDEDLVGGRYNYPIFGGGPRACMGKQFALLVLRMFLIELARACEWEVVEGDSIKWAFLPVPSPHNGMPTDFYKLTTDDIERELESNDNDES